MKKLKIRYYENNNRVMHKEETAKVGYMAYMCPRCYNIIYVKQDLTFRYENHKSDDIQLITNVSASINCKDCNKELLAIELDPNIAEVISILNKKGYATVSSCEGHSAIYRNAYIAFNNPFLAALDEFQKLPDSWYIDKSDDTDGKFIIRAHSKYGLERRINDIKEWALKIGKYNWK